jgi:hypothetical protein
MEHQRGVQIIRQAVRPAVVAGAATANYRSESNLELHPEEQGVVVHVGQGVRRTGDRHFADLRYIGLKLDVVAAEVPVDAAGVLPRGFAEGPLQPVIVFF